MTSSVPPIFLGVTEVRDRSLFDELSEVDRADLLRTVIRLHAVLEPRMIAVGLNPSRCAEGPRAGKALWRNNSRMKSGSWNGKRQVGAGPPRQKKKWGIQDPELIRHVNTSCVLVSSLARQSCNRRISLANWISFLYNPRVCGEVRRPAGKGRHHARRHRKRIRA